jgi:microcin C transport system substrate-binding protein
MALNRRTLMQLTGAVPLSKIIGVSVAHADEPKFSHAITLYDDIKYPDGFKHFDYVNPNAPKGGKVRLYALGSFDSVNLYTIKGDPHVKQFFPTYVGNEVLVTRALDEPTTDYGLLASGVWFPEDRSRVVYKLRKEATFHDGIAVTADDIIWSLETLKRVHPQGASYWKNISKAEQTGDHEITFFFDTPGNRELPGIAGQVPALPKHWWTGKDASGKDRNIAEASLEAPLGSGAYRLGNIKAGQSFSLLRAENYWGKDLPVNVGIDNFDEIEYIFFRDQTVAFEAFKGDQYDYRLEGSAKSWATGYDFPAVKDGRVIKKKIVLEEVQPIQAWTMNLRRPKFQDERVRRAFNLAFDFEWSNQNLFYGQYTRARSIFNNSEFEAKGQPSPEELALLEPLRADLPASVFTAEYSNPLNDTPANRRNNLRQASKLLAEAGWNVTADGGKNILKNAKGEKLDVEILLDSPIFERIALPYQQQLELLGFGVSIRTIDPAQYEQRQQNFDYDITVGAWPQSLSPGNEQRDFWSSDAADKPGSRNLAGIKNKAVDTLIEKMIFVKDRKSLVTACKALDRAVMANNYFVPMWYAPYDRIAYWNRFSAPDNPPPYATGFPSIWWWDEDKAKKTKA